MNSLIIFSMLLVGSLAMPQFIQPVTFQAGQPAAIISSPTFLTSPQLFAQPTALLTQPTIQQEEPVQEAQPAQADQTGLLRDPNNPSADILLHSGFPFVSSFQTGLQTPFTLQAQPLTRVNINSVLPQQSAQLQQQPAAAAIVQPQAAAQTFALPSLTAAAPAQQAASALPASPLVFTQLQPATQLRTLSPFTLAGPFTVATQ